MAFKESLYDPKHCETAVRVLSEGKSLAAVCVELDICRATLYNWRDAHPEFKMALDKGLQHAQLKLEELGMKGMSGEIKSFAGSPWVFTMKNRFRSDYADQDALVLAGQNDRMREELKELRAELNEKHKKEY
jgi:hypothetical protein